MVSRVVQLSSADRCQNGPSFLMLEMVVASVINTEAYDRLCHRCYLGYWSYRAPVSVRIGQPGEARSGFELMHELLEDRWINNDNRQKASIEVSAFGERIKVLD